MDAAAAALTIALRVLDDLPQRATLDASLLPGDSALRLEMPGPWASQARAGSGAPDWCRRALRFSNTWRVIGLTTWLRM